MHQFFRRNSKKLLALVGVFLMVSFVATARMPNSGERTPVLIGMAGDQKIFSSDIDAAKSDYRILSETLMYQERTGEWEPLFHSGMPLIELGEEPKLFVLLQRQARQMGIAVSDQPIDQELSRYIGIQIAFRSAAGTVVPLSDLAATDDSDRVQEIQTASQHLLLVLMGLYRAIDVNKVSQPLRDLTLAEDHQQIQVKLVVLDAHQQLSRIPAPTTQQLNQQFSEFADTPASGMSSAKNPFGFGYQIKERFKIEAISVKRDDVASAVHKTKSDYDWDVAAHYYYDKHQSDYATTQPSTQPTSQPTLLPNTISATLPTTIPTAALSAASTTLPTTPATTPAITPVTSLPAATTKPFDSVKSDVMTAVMKPQIDELYDKAQRAIASTLAADWSAYHAAHPTTNSIATSQPTIVSSLGVEYASKDYLPALAAKVQKDLGVMPVIEQLAQPFTVDEAPQLAGIGAAHSSDSSISFVDTLTDSSLLLLQPSVPLNNDAGDVSSIFRIDERIAAHKPESVSPVESVVTADWKLTRAFELCRLDAAQLQATAIRDGLASAAHGMNVSLQSPAPFGIAGRGTQEPITGLPLSGDTVDAFRNQCRSLLTDAAQHKPPVISVESPHDAKIVVAELSGVTPQWPAGYRSFAESQTVVELRRQLSQPITAGWFNFASVAQSAGYKDVGSNDAAQKPAG